MCMQNMMAGCGKLIFSLDLGNFLHGRNYLLNICQSISKTATQDVNFTKPKRPLSTFLLYVRSARPRIVQENPNMKPAEVIKRASEEWAKLEPIQKEDFKKQYCSNYEIYIQQLKEFESCLPEDEKIKQKQSSKSKSNCLGKPTKPTNAFLLYVNSKRTEKGPTIPFKEWLRVKALSWKNMTTTEKEPYVSKAKELMKQYQQDLDLWERKMNG
ncbi:mitochondrial transcription factor A isoform X1 [Calliopsis andreniformis]|uniref:mitochondrial transcription factor A isoform X1 n=1 Tax=Calliopsis andreniformis TaxID=337506 RepID=UPI003FCE50FF